MIDILISIGILAVPILIIVAAIMYADYLTLRDLKKMSEEQKKVFIESVKSKYKYN